MKTRTGLASKGKSPSEEIDTIIENHDDWRGEKLSRLRALIKKADPAVVEEVKWKKPSNPMGVPVWSHDGIICIGEALKNAVRLTFPKGAQVKDPKELFNTRLESNAVRAIDIHENDSINEVGTEESHPHCRVAEPSQVAIRLGKHLAARQSASPRVEDFSFLIGRMSLSKYQQFSVCWKIVVPKPQFKVHIRDR
jgi:hypothetical protein